MPGLLLRNPLGDVAGDRDRPLCDAVDRDESEGHLDIELAAALVQRASQGRTSLKLQDAIRHGVIEPAPVRRAKMARHDQVKTLTQRLRGAEPEQRRGGAIPSGDPSRLVGEDHGVRDLIENVVCKIRWFVHAPSLTGLVRAAIAAHRRRGTPRTPEARRRPRYASRAVQNQAAPPSRPARSRRR